MIAKTIPFSWIVEEKHRLDCGPFTRGGIEARKALEKLRCPKHPLVEITLGGMSGIYHVGMDKLRWVEGAEHGIPFLRSSDILKADLSNQPYISKQQVRGNKLFTCPEGTTLITRSGTIGRMAYCRCDMAEMAMSQDVLKVVPDASKIASGYMFAFLSSRFGIPLIVSGTFGSIITHIEAENIADLPVPRFGESFERKVHSLIETASTLRVNSAATLRKVAKQFDALIADVDLRQDSPQVALVPASSIQSRFDAQFHDPVVQRIRASLGKNAHTTIGAWCTRVFLPGIFKRIYTPDPKFGAPYYTGTTLFWLEPLPKGILSRKTTLFDDVSLEKGTVLVQAFGQDGGLTGRSVWVGKNLDHVTTTHMLVRLNTMSLEKAAYLYGFLQSDAAYRQIASLTYGGSIPHFDEAGISSVIIPQHDTEVEQRISKEVLDAVDAQDEALNAERSAREMVEHAIQEGAQWPK